MLKNDYEGRSTMKKKLIIFISSLIIFTPALTGCVFSNSDDNENILTDSIRETGENVTNFVGGGLLTDDKSLKGERTFREDEYMGTYLAEYQKFSGVEILFGGASLERKSDDTIHIKSNLDIQNGDVKIYWTSGEDNQKLLFEESGSTTVQLSSGWEYLSIEGNEVEGNVSIEIE